MAQSSLSKLSICFGRFGNSQFWVAKNWLATKKTHVFFWQTSFLLVVISTSVFFFFFGGGFCLSDFWTATHAKVATTMQHWSVQNKASWLVNLAESSCNSLTEKFQAIKKYLSTSTQQIYTGKKPWRIMKILWMIFFSEVTFHWRKIY